MVAAGSSPDSRALPDRPHVRPPRRPSPRLSRRQLLTSLILSLWLLADLLGGWIFLIPQAYAAKRPSDPPARTTFHTFLKDKRHDHVSRGRFVFPSKAPAVPRGPHDHATTMSQLPPSGELPTMQPLNQVLPSSLLTTGPTSSTPLNLKGSDGRLELLIQPNSLDLSQAVTVSAQGTPGGAPSSPLTLQVTQQSGHYAATVNLLGTYRLQVVDSQGRAVSGIRLSSSMSIIYHYQPGDFDSLDLDPGNLLMSWPTLLVAARAAKQPTTGLVTPVVNDATARTLTGQSSVLGPGPLSVGGDPSDQSPPVPLVAGEQGNSGQLGLSYPLLVPPNARNFVPQLILSYSSGNTNQRTSPTSPGGAAGDGWSLTVGAITAQKYPSGSASTNTWYFLSGVGNISDRLVPDTQANFYLTEHMSHLRIHQVTGDNSQPCFNVYATDGTFYEFGCNSDALQYWTDSGGSRHNYRWDLDKIISPNEGPTAQREYIYFTYLQDSTSSNGHTSIRDSAIKQITYGQHLPDKSQETVAGTIDFAYRAPFSNPPWTTSYGTNYNCYQTPPTSTTKRCDNPVDRGSVNAPMVMSTFSLQSLTAYVGDDSTSSHKAYRYNFTYQDYPFYSCQDPYTEADEYCAGKHLLTSITPSVYQNSVQHTLKPVTMSYTRQDDHYYDSEHTTQDGADQYGVSTTWHYLTDYQDTNTGVGEHVTYMEAFANTHGTPYITDGGGNIIDDRHDPLYCSLHASDCNGHYDNPDDHAWSVQVVTSITSWGKDSSASTLAPATTTYHYRLEAKGTYDGNSDGYCYPAPGSPPPAGQSDCTFDTWIPGNAGTQDNDW